VKVGIAYSLAPSATDQPLDGPDDRFEEFDKPETVEAIAAIIRGEGHEVILLGDGREFLTRVLADRPDFVFNIAEGEGVGRCREARVPAVLEMLNIPYSGSDPLTLAACLDKEVAKRLVGHNCPRGSVSVCPVLTDEEEERRFMSGVYELFEPLIPGEPVDLNQHPLILKPAFEGSSKGIHRSAIATTEAEVIFNYRLLRRDYNQPILIEEFIIGEEVTVGVFGNWSPERGTEIEVFGTMRVVPRQSTDRFVYSLEVKRDWRNQIDYETPAVVPGVDLWKIEYAAQLAYIHLGCRDFARIDFRVRDGVPYFIEANPLPGLAPVSSDLVILAAGYGISHAELIRKILHAALVRVGLA